MVINRLTSPFRNTVRLRYILKVFLRHGFRDFIGKLNLEGYLPLAKTMEFLNVFGDEEKKLTAPERFRMVFEELGPTFIKFGQLLSTRPDYIPSEYIQEFKKLQDNVPPFSKEEVEKIIKKEYGPDASVEQIFKTFDFKPVAAASVAQVHIGTLISGEEVAVKIQRPDIEEVIHQDIRILYRLAGLIERNFEESRLLDPVGIVDEFEKTILKELDFITEGSSIEKFRANFKDFPGIYIPNVFWDYTTRRILVVERVNGLELDEVKKIKEKGHDPKKIADIGLNCFCKQIMEDGFFHADPHPGNSMLMDDGRIALIDFGITGSLDNEMMENIANVFIGYSEHDYEKLVKTFSKMGITNENTDIPVFKQDLKDLSEPFYGRSLKHISVKEIFDKITQTCLKHNIKLPKDLLLLFKTFLQIEALGRDLDPDSSVLEKAKPYALRLLDRGHNPRVAIKNFKKDMADLYSLMKVIPENVKNVLVQLSKGNLRFEFMHLGFEKINIDIVRGINRITMGIVISASIIGSALVISSGTEVLPVTITGFGKVSLTTLIGLLGFTISTLLSIWLVISIIRSDKQ
ncbi:MAG: AarF/ABC1/UbiB kinase family protein [bacterium]|nr:AarF/ABC1/UbiB kinase family protein [bacterium]